MRISEAETCLFFLAYIVCMHEARPALSMRKTPAWYRDPPRCGAWSFPNFCAEWDKSVQRARVLFCSSSPPTRCHVAQPVWLKSWIINRQIYVKCFCWLFVSLVPNWIFLFPVRFVQQCFFLERHTKLQQWGFIKLPNLGKATALNPWMNYLTCRLVLQLSHLDQNEIF